MVSIRIVEPAVARYETIQRLVKDHDVRQIGRGLFATVLAAQRGKIVYKVCRDSAYLAFVTAVLEYQDNPWFPRIYSASLYYPVDEPWYFITAMERLRRGTERELHAALLLLDTNLDDILLIGRTLHVSKPRMRKLAEMQRLLHKLFKDFGPDFHHGNVLFRGNHPVIIDPIVDTEESQILE